MSSWLSGTAKPSVAMDPKKDGSRDPKRLQPSRSTSSSQESLKSAKPNPSPTFLTSFPSFSPPPDMSKSRRKVSTPVQSPTDLTPNAQASKQKNRAVTTPLATKKPAPNANEAPATSAVNRTVQAAANLRRTIMDSITSRQGPQTSPNKIFSGMDEGAADPLLGASDEHVQRIIASSGGPVSTVKKYSSDLAESNERVATERNSKLRLVEENRQLRAQLLDKEQDVVDMKRQVEVVKQLFQRYLVKKHSSDDKLPTLQIVDSPSGPYALEDTSGTILATLTDDFIFPDASPMETPEGSSMNDEILQILVQRGKSIDTIRPNDTIRPRKQSKPPRLPQRLVSAIKSETVEMKSPVNTANLPPALRESTTPNEALVDRLGFYITPDRERRHQEAAMYPNEDLSESSSINSNHKEDEESLLSTNELLCDAPTGPATKLIFRSESTNSLKVFIEVGKSTKSNDSATISNPATTTHVAADITAPSAASKLSALLNPIQDSKALTSLLLKLNQAFDLQQKKRTHEWTAFYEQTQDLLHKGAENSLDEHNIAGVAALCSASNVSPEVRNAFNGLIRRGVPVSFRREVWLERSGANNIRDPELYDSLQHDTLTDKVTLREIDVDVDRTLANNVFFREGVGKDRLHSILVAFASHNPDIGYSQGLNIIAANLLLMVPAPEDGFALLEILVRDILPSAYYSRDGGISGLALERDGQVTESYVSDLFPALHKHLRAKGAPLTMFTPGWFISGFASCVNGEALYRLWDLMFGFCDGRFVFCFALALLKLNRRGLMGCSDAEELMSYLGGRMSSAAVSLDSLINETFKMGEKVTLGDIHKRRSGVEKRLNGS